MGYLKGLKEYCWEHYRTSVFKQLEASKEVHILHLHGRDAIRARVLENLKYEVRVEVEGQGELLLHKTEIKLVYAPENAKAVQKQLKADPKVKAQKLDPILKSKGRNFIKNKTLYPLMKDREVLFFTLLEGEVLRGVILDFCQFEIILGLKGGVPVHILRHSIHDVRDKKGRCFLKKFQNKYRDWQKSGLFVEGSQPDPHGQPNSTGVDGGVDGEGVPESGEEGREMELETDGAKAPGAVTGLKTADGNPGALAAGVGEASEDGQKAEQG